MRMMRILCVGLLGTLVVPLQAEAQGVAAFYEGKQIRVLLGGVGGGLDLQVRVMARHFPKYMPGRPAIIAQNMVGSGGIQRANYLYKVAQQDGTYLGAVANNFPALQAIGRKGIEFDVTKFNWIGSFGPTVDTFVVWHEAGVTDLRQLGEKQIVAGATGRESITYILPTLMNAFLGTNIKIVTGYTGGGPINVAMERREVDARVNNWQSIRATSAQWLAEKKIHVLLRAGPELKELQVPSLEELAKNEDDRRVIELAVSGAYLGRPLATTPQVPSDRLAALREAFDSTMADPQFIAESEKLKLEVELVRGTEIQAYVAKLMTFPPQLVPKAREILGD